MIIHADPTDADEPPPSAEQRRRWLEAVQFPSPGESVFSTA
ncbi:hypothetical protein [uncultured Tessaracoccus sp.]|nr:hypothetical protein [uncultured Tessaracoccus sp.]